MPVLSLFNHSLEAMRIHLGLPFRYLAVFGAARIVAAVPSPGCTNATEQSQADTDSTTNVKLETSDGTRNYLLYIPKNYEATTPAPLILSYHGGSRDAEHQEQLDQFNSTFFNKKYMVIYPNSVDVSSRDQFFEVTRLEE